MASIASLAQLDGLLEKRQQYALVGDGEQGLAGLLDSRKERGHQGGGGLLVKAAGRLVEQDDGLLAGDGDGGHQAASLAAGEEAGIFAERGVDALWQGGDDLIELGVS